MTVDRRWSFGLLCALPFVAIGLAGARPLHDLPRHDFIGLALFIAAAVCLWRLIGSNPAGGLRPRSSIVLAGVLLLAPWMLVGLTWVGIGAPFQASTLENQHRYVLLMVNALLVGAGFVVLGGALRDLGERLFSGALFAAAVPATGLYLTCIAITLAQATMAVQGDRTPVPPILGHLYDVLEFFAASTTYVCTGLAAVAMGRAGILGRVAVRVYVGVCLAILVLLALRGIEFPEISGQTAPWLTQPGVIVRIPAIPWLMPGLLAAVLLGFAGSKPKRIDP